MADSKLSALAALAGADAADGDLFYVDDISVTTSKSITRAELKIAMGIMSGTQGSTFTFNGSGGSTGSLTMTYQKIGNMVMLNIPAASATTGTNSSALVSDTALPAAIRPSSTQRGPMADMQNNGGASTSAGLWSLSTAGIISIFKDNAGALFTDGAAAGTFNNQTITYFIG